jgi:hypothetical protein
MTLENTAGKVWQIAPGSMSLSLPAYCLPNQLERVTDTAYSYYWADGGDREDLQRQMAGGIERFQAPTRGFLLKDAFLFDGAIHKANFGTRLYPRAGRLPQFYIEHEIERGAVHSTFDGNMFFGLWLTDDCTIYPLAANEGLPITTDQPASPHTLAYEDWLGMKPVRLHSAFLREVVLFDDRLQNQDKATRFRAISDKLLSRVKVEPHPGVFIIRGSSGKRRILHNERELAEYLHERRGFRIVDINVADVPTILAACAGAQVVAGVEGSHLIHGVMVLQPGGAVLALQPPDRFCAVIKRTTDRDGQHYGFVVGHAEGDGFRIDPVEVERTLDLFPT